MQSRTKKKQVDITKYMVYIIFVFAIAIFALWLGGMFFSVTNLLNIIRQTAAISVMAVGMTFVLATGGIDLTISGIVPTAGLVSAMILNATNNIFLGVAVPLAMTADDAWEMYEAAQKAGVIHAVGHNNRALSGIRFIKKMIDEGKFGKIYSIQMRYIQSWGMDPEAPMQWRFDASKAGTGTLGDTGSHALDIGRYLLGNIKRVSSLNSTFVKERNVAAGALLSKVPDKDQITGRQKVDVDDDTKSVVEFESGVTGFLWSSRFCIGQEDTLDIEIYGSEGAAKFSRERPNEVQVVFKSDGDELRGFRTIKMGPAHPNGELWPMADLGVGYVEQKCVEYKAFFDAIANDDPSLVSCSFYDGFKVCQVVDAIKKSSETGNWEYIDNTK